MEKAEKENISRTGDGDSAMDGIRTVAVRAAFIFGLTFIAAWILREDLTALLRWPLVSAFGETGAETVLLRVIDMFMVHVKLCFYVSMILTLPYLFVATWKRLASMMQRREMKLERFTPAWMILLFSIGIAFAYFIVMPLAFSFLVDYSMEGEGILLGKGREEAINLLQVSMREHVSFTMGLLLGFGLGFQAPVVMSALAKTGLVTAEGFASRRGLALVAMAIVSSILTPPDPWTLLLMLCPLYLLYEIGIVASRVRGRSKS